MTWNLFSSQIELHVIFWLCRWERFNHEPWLAKSWLVVKIIAALCHWSKFFFTTALNGLNIFLAKRTTTRVMTGEHSLLKKIYQLLCRLLSFSGRNKQLPQSQLTKIEICSRCSSNLQNPVGGTKHFFFLYLKNLLYHSLDCSSVCLL